MRRQAPSARSIVTAMVAGGLVAIALATTAGVQASSYTSTSYALRLLALVNGAREQHGLEDLALASGTESVAAAWTQHLAGARILAHNPQLAHELATHGSHSWRTYGENVGVGSADDPDGLFTAYMNSPEHRANILTGAYRFVGVWVVLTGSRAWNTFDFVDVYGDEGSVIRHYVPARPHLHVLQQPTTNAGSISLAATTPATPDPVARPARRPTRTPLVQVKALRGPPPRVPVAAVVGSALPTASPTTAPNDIRPPVSRSHAVVIALAVLVLSLAGRRWMLLR
jgi:uncharacterized protein YkwD